MLNGYQTVHFHAGARDGTLREKRLVLEMTQQQVAEKAKISLSSYQKFESGERNIRTASFEIACRVIKALGMDPTAFYEGEYVFGEPTIFDKEGHKYVRTGRFVNEDIDDREAINVTRMHIIDRAMLIPLKILRALDDPEFINFLYNNEKKSIAIKVIKTHESNCFSIPEETYSGKWRGIRIEDEELINLVFSLIEKKECNFMCMPQFYKNGCTFSLDEIEPSGNELDREKFLLLETESRPKND